MERTLIMCGDIHGALTELVYNLVEKRKVENSDVLILGDFGAGFGGPKSVQVMYDKVKRRLEKNNLHLYAIRGNHDNPKFFDGTHDYGLLTLLPDHKVIELCGKRIYPVGGAVSEDIDFRMPSGRTRRIENERLIKFGSSRRLWWENEGPEEKMKDLPVAVDIIVSHDAPLGFEPVAIREDSINPDTWEKVVRCRKYLDHVLYEVRASWWFYGHHHHTYSGHVGDLKYRCLGINELFTVAP